MELPEHQDSPATRVSPDYQGVLERRAARVQSALREVQVSRGCRELLDPTALLVLQECLEPQGLRDLKVRMEHRVLTVIQDNRDPWDLLELLVLKEP